MVNRRTLPIVVYGAYGRAGQLIARSLARAGNQVVVAGRRAARLRPLAVELGCLAHEVSLEDGGRLQALVAASRIVINCAGPFHGTALPIAKAAIANGAHYVDISGERRSVRAICDLDDVAKNAGVAVVPAAGAKGGLGVWAAALGFDSGWFDRRATGSTRIAYAHAGSAYWRPTPAALLSTAAEGVEWEAARPLDHGLPPRRFEFPPPFAPGLGVHVSGAEDVLLPRLGITPSVSSYLSVDPGGRANVAWGLLHHAICAPLTRPAAPVFWRAAIEAGPARLESLLQPPERGAIAMVVEAGGIAGARRRIAITGADGYEVTAATVRLCVERLCSSSPSGVVSVAGLVQPAVALATLAKGVVRVVRGDRIRRSTPVSVAR